MKIAIGCDPNAASLMQMIEALCVETGNEPVLVGKDDPIYANTAILVGEGGASGSMIGVFLCAAPVSE